MTTPARHISAFDSDLEVRLLGPVEALRGGLALDIGGKRQRRLLALLAVEPQTTIPADRLADDLWAGEPPDGATTTLRAYVSRLRAALGEPAAIRGSTSGYALGLDVGAVDVTRFEGIVGDARSLIEDHPRRAAASARAALALWRGQPFGEAGDEGALATHAVRLRELRLEAIELRIDADLRLGHASDLVAELEALVADHPFRERLWRHLMLALYRADRQADALAAYHRARRVLVDELGVDPGPELAALEGAILRHDLPAVAPAEARHNLPADVTTFVGRRIELEQVASLLESSRLITLTGIGGVGKTRLGLAAARERQSQLADGAWFVDLARLSAPDLLPAEVAAALAAPEDAGATPMQRLLDHLRGREALLLLDNCEHLVEASATLASGVLERCPDVRILATSRLPLGIAGEAVFPVPPLSLVAVPGDAARADAVALFVNRAVSASPDLDIDAEVIDVIARICRDLEGLPLAIELAAARVRALGVPDIALRLRNRFRFLVSWRRIAAARHRTLLEAMDWSYELLDPAARQLLERLSVFAGGFDLAAATAVSDAKDETDALDVLERLIDASLVVFLRTPKPGRYRLLETVREYGAGRLVDSGDEQMVRRLHTDYYARLAEAAAVPIRDGPDDQAWMDRLALERGNLRAALASLRDNGNWAGLLRASEALWRYWWVRGEAAEGRAWLASAVAGQEAAGEGDPMLLGGALQGLAGLAWSEGDFDTALAYALRSDAMFELAHDDFRRGTGSWNTIGVIESGRRNWAEARAAFERSIDFIRSADVDPAVRARRLAVSLDNLGSTYFESGDFAKAVGLYEEARKLHSTVGGGLETALYDLHLARSAIRLGHAEGAPALLAQALEHYRGLGFLQYVTECLEGIAYVANATGRPADAAVLLGATSALRERTRTPYWGQMLDEVKQETARATAELGDEAFRSAFESGRSDPEAAIERARELVGVGLSA